MCNSTLSLLATKEGLEQRKSKFTFQYLLRVTPALAVWGFFPTCSELPSYSHCMARYLSCKEQSEKCLLLITNGSACKQLCKSSVSEHFQVPSKHQKNSIGLLNRK